MYTAAYVPETNKWVIDLLNNNGFDQVVIEYKDGYYITYNSYEYAVLNSEFNIKEINQMIRETRFRVVKTDGVNTLYLYPNKNRYNSPHVGTNVCDNRDDMYIYDGNTKNSPRHKVKSHEEKLNELEQELEETSQKIKDLKKNSKPHDYSLDMLDWFTNGALLILLILGIACWYSPGGKILSYLIGIGIAGFGWIRDRSS